MNDMPEAVNIAVPIFTQEYQEKQRGQDASTAGARTCGTTKLLTPGGGMRLFLNLR